MAIFTAISAAIVGAIGLTGVVATIATSLIAGGLALGVSKLIAPRGSSGSTQQEDAISGGRIQLPPATNNKLPVVYGTAFIGGSIIDAKISSDLQSMWYVIALAEVTNTMPGDTPDTITFDEIYYDGKLATLSGAQVTSLTSNTAGTPEVDSKINGNLFIYLFPNGSSSGTNTGGQSAITIMSDADIPSDQRWNQGIYTASGQSASMTNTAFIIVKVKYNQDAGTTSLGTVTAKITNSRTKPGDCIKDYLLNDRYGCGVTASSINTASLTALDTYSDKPIVYTPMGGGPTTTQVRYRLNGPLDTTKNCLANLQDMVDACDSWMQYTELTGQWKVIINKAYDETPNAIAFNSLYSVTNNNLTSGINVNPTDLNQTFNQVEYQYPNTNIKDQLDFIFIALQDDYPSLLSENEPLNKLSLKNDLVNNYVQAKFIAIRRILQGREDLIITLQTDYSGIQVEAGDVIRITNEVYGWTDKLFRVSNVVEEKDAEGNLFARLTAFEYNATIYDDNLGITDFIPADNTGLKDPNILGTPAAPIVIVNTANTLNTMNITGTVPTGGLVRYLDFNYGTSINSSNHSYYTSSTNSNGAPLLANTPYTINVNELAAGNLYWSVSARNDIVGVRSNSSNLVVWPGSNITTAVTTNANNASSSGNLITTDPISNNIIGGLITIIGGTGNFAANTYISEVISNTQFTVTIPPTVPLGNASINISTGGITGNNIQPGSITANNLASGASKIAVQDEGNIILDSGTLNFVGNAVAVSNVGNVATITITSTGGNGITGIAVQDEGNAVVTSNTMNFVGNAVAVSNVGNVATISITSGGITGIAVQDEGNAIVTSNTMNFVGNAVSVSNVGNVATVTITSTGGNGITGIAVQDEGTTILTSNTINFVGSAVAVSNVSNIATITVTGGSGNGIYEYINDNSFALAGGVNPTQAINIKGSYGAARIPADRQANASTGNFETYTFDSYYPWWTGNSLTTNGYFANSGSGRMNPDDAGIQDISSPAALGGRAGWWTVIGSGVTSSYRTANTQIRNQSQVQVVSDTQLEVQVAGWYKIQQISNVANISNAIKLDTTITTSVVYDTTPQIFNLDFSVDANATFAIYDVGMCMRVLSLGTGNVFVLTGQSLTTTPSGWDYDNVYWIRP